VAYSGSSLSIFDTVVAGEDCLMRVSGHGVFKSVGSSVPIVNAGRADDDIYIECDRMEAYNDVIQAMGKLLLRCNFLSSAGSRILTPINSYLDATIYADEMRTEGYEAIYMDAGLVRIFTNRIVATAGNGIYFLGGELHVSAYEIVSGSDYAVQHNSYDGNCWAIITREATWLLCRLLRGLGTLTLDDPRNGQDVSKTLE
jgi:hypothetical protein